MQTNSQSRAFGSEPGPELIWLLPFAMLWFIGFAVLFSFEPALSLIAFITVLVAAGVGKVVVGPAKFFIAVMPALIATIALIATLTLITEASKPPPSEIEGNQFGFLDGPPPPPRLLPSVRNWFSLSDFSYSAKIRFSAERDRSKFAHLSGDVLIKSFDWERPTTNRLIAGCDARCRGLLQNPNVTSVTIQPDRSLFWEGPRVLMPGYRPASHTYQLRDDERCDGILSDTASDTKRKPETMVEALKIAQHTTKFRIWCLKNNPVELSHFDRTLTDENF